GNGAVDENTNTQSKTLGSRFGSFVSSVSDFGRSLSKSQKQDDKTEVISLDEMVGAAPSSANQKAKFHAIQVEKEQLEDRLVFLRSRLMELEKDLIDRQALRDKIQAEVLKSLKKEHEALEREKNELDNLRQTKQEEAEDFFNTLKLKLYNDFMAEMQQTRINQKEVLEDRIAPLLGAISQSLFSRLGDLYDRPKVRSAVSKFNSDVAALVKKSFDIPLDEKGQLKEVDENQDFMVFLSRIAHERPQRKGHDHTKTADILFLSFYETPTFKSTMRAVLLISTLAFIVALDYRYGNQQVIPKALDYIKWGYQWLGYYLHQFLAR
ncbi:MAG: hypothetical protein KDD22_01270, partial [Bdellovibrionales bacterium]|nr:hypothetical protein [Bdellovibrionales bacterium]